MGKKSAVFFLVLFTVLNPCSIKASGFGPFELSARAAALGGAFAALADDASAVYYNPAGLAFSSGTMVRTNIYYPRVALTAEYPAFPAPYHSNLGGLRTAHFVSTSLFNRIGLGIGVFTPNSMETEWPENWTGRGLSIHSKLNTLYIRPAIAVKISKFLSLGVGMDFISSSANWKNERIFTFHEM
jgi:long-chain fatty acid transport protein